MSWLQLARYSLLAYDLGQTPRWQPDKVVRLQQRRLAELWRYVTAHSPFYRDKLRGWNPARDGLAAAPVTTKHEIREHFDRVVTDPALNRTQLEAWVADEGNLGVWHQGRYCVSHTSGSQGAPLLIVQDRRNIELMYAILGARAHAGETPGVLEGLRRLGTPKRVAIVTFRRGFYPSGAAFEFMQQIVGRFVQVMRLSSLDPDLLPRLQEFQPHVISSYASVLEALAMQSDSLRLRELRHLTNSSEQLTPRIRSRVEQAFGAPVLDHYGTGECLFLGEACRTHGGVHVNADWAIVEIVDEQYRPVPPGELGAKVLVTNLANRVQPFIRYEVGDRAAWATEPCSCGSRLPRIERIDGRSADLFWVESAGKLRALPGVLWHSAVDEFAEVREWQAIQTQRNRVEIRVALMPDADPSGERLRVQLPSRLESLGMPAGVDLDLYFVPHIAVDSTTGKMRRIVSLVGPAAG